MLQQRRPTTAAAATLLLTALVACLAAVLEPAGAAQHDAVPGTLVPFQYVTGQLIDLDTGIRTYELSQLKPSTGYEVRVSFPASIPATLQFRLASRATAAEAAAGRAAALWHKAAGRRLLDCEKLLFETDARGQAQGLLEPYLVLRALRRSVHRDGPKAGAQQLVFNVVLAELLWSGGLPLDSIPTVAAVVLIVLITFVWSLYWSNSLFPRLLAALTAGSTTPPSSSIGNHNGPSDAPLAASGHSKRAH